MLVLRSNTHKQRWEILAYSPVNIVCKILDPQLKDDWLDKVETNTNVIIE